MTKTEMQVMEFFGRQEKAIPLQNFKSILQRKKAGRTNFEYILA